MGISRKSPRTVLAQNLKALMGREDLSQAGLGKKSGIAQSTIGRILAEKHAPDIDTLDAIAKTFHLNAWQMMVPNLDPSNPPLLQNASPQERELYERLKAAAELLTPPKTQ